MKKKPNILHLFTDMQRADTIHALGNPVIRTPALDRLVREGTAFTNAFSPSPVCVSARCSMIHGQYPAHTGCYENTLMPADGRQSFMDGLSAAGYRTHGIGKCHFTPDAYALRGFQSREVQEEGGVPMKDLDKSHYLKYLRDKGYDHIMEAYGVRGEMYYHPQPSQIPAKDHPSQWLGDRSIDFIKGQENKDESWYLYSSFIHPHPPFTPPAPWHKLYRPATMPLPNMPQDTEALLTYINRAQNRYKYRDQGRDLNLVRNIIAYYYACISFVDYQIGRIVAELDRQGILEDTLILFSSDHGEFLGDLGCYGKRSMHDPASRVPLIVRYPQRFAQGAVCQKPANLVDLAPTFLAAAGTTLQSHEADGIDLAELAGGRSQRQYVFSQLCVPPGMVAVFLGHPETPEFATDAERRAAYSSYMCVSERWKYVYSATDGAEFLFDRINDPKETRNRKGVLFCQDALVEHRSALMAHLRSMGETAGLDGDSWKAFPKRQLDADPDTGLLIQDLHTPWAKLELPEGYRP